MMEIRAKARRLKQRHDLKMVVVDYMQLMTSGKKVESRQQEVSEFSRSLKLWAKELEVPVIAISQPTVARNSAPTNARRSRTCASRLPPGVDAHPPCRYRRTSDTGRADGIGRATAGGRSMSACGWWHARQKVFQRAQGSVPPTLGIRPHCGGNGQTTRWATVDGWIALRILKVGDRVAAPRSVPEPAETKEMANDDELVMLRMIGDGSCVKRQPLRYASVDEANLSAVTIAAKAWGSRGCPRRLRSNTGDDTPATGAVPPHTRQAEPYRQVAR